MKNLIFTSKRVTAFLIKVIEITKFALKFHLNQMRIQRGEKNQLNIQEKTEA